MSKQTIYREGDRIRATNGTGYHDRVTDEAIEKNIGGSSESWPESPESAAEHDAFARAVLAIRAYERLATP